MRLDSAYLPMYAYFSPDSLITTQVVNLLSVDAIHVVATTDEPLASFIIINRSFCLKIYTLPLETCQLIFTSNVQNYQQWYQLFLLLVCFPLFRLIRRLYYY